MKVRFMSRSHILVLIALFITTNHTEARTWTDSKGRKVNAEFTSCHNGIVRMKTAEGKTYRVPVWTLSRQDQMFVVKTKGWAVVKVYRQANVKASLTVRISERVTSDRLTEIANELRGFADNRQPRLFISYYLPEMKIAGRCWATSHFSPDLSIKILGTFREEHARLQKVASEPAGEGVIGRWMDKTAFPGVVTLLREEGKVFMTKVFQDGSKGKYEMVITKVGLEVRYSKKDAKTSDYLIIRMTGDLGHGDDEGVWASSPKIK